MALVDLGFMKVRKDHPLSGGDDVFHVTDAGKTAVVAESPTPPKLSPGKQRYQDWLDYDSGISFIDYLKMRSHHRATGGWS
jgi:hypothetical protein